MQPPKVIRLHPPVRAGQRLTRDQRRRLAIALARLLRETVAGRQPEEAMRPAA